MGGAINNERANEFIMTRCTISGNQAQRYGGAIHSSSPMNRFINCTIYNNSLEGATTWAVGGAFAIQKQQYTF